MSPRAEIVAEIERGLLELYRDPTLNEKPALLEQRGGAFYSEAATGLVASLVSNDGVVHEVDIRNDGTLAGLADDDVVEVPARVENGRLSPLPQAPLAPELLGLAQHVAAYERLAAQAAVTADPAVARKALLAHPLIGQHPLNEDLVERLLEAERIGTDGTGMTAPIVLAVDGGNSKTDLALVAADGRVLSLVRGPLSSPHHLGVDGSVEVLERLFRQAVQEAGVANANGAPVAAVARLCMAGVDFPAEEEVLQERIAGSAGPRRPRSPTTRSPSCGPAPRAAGASRSSAAPASTASASGRTGARCGSRRSASSAATGAEATTSAWPRSRRRPAARTAAAPRPPSSAPSRLTSGWRSPRT